MADATKMQQIMGNPTSIRQFDNPQKVEPNRFDYIDAVRGMALAVLVMHCTIVTGPFFGSSLLAQGNYG